MIRSSLVLSCYNFLRQLGSPNPPYYSLKQEELRVLEQAVVFANELASNVVWSQLAHRYALPAAGCVLLAEKDEEKEEGLCFKPLT